MSLSDGWTRAFYETPVAASLLPVSQAELDLRVACIERALGLRGGERLLDQCCGAGSIALALARKGHPVIGVDISSAFVDQARADARGQARADARGQQARADARGQARADARGQARADARAEGQAGRLDAEFACADATAWTSPTPCDAGFNWGTGFGCFASDDANRAMLARAWDSLRPGAPFALDYYNVAGVLAGFRPEFAYERELGGRTVRVERRSVLDLERGLLHQDWSFHDAGQVTSMPRTTTRLYLPAELTALLASVGFTVQGFLGGYDGRPLDLDAPRCIVIVRRSL